MDIHSELEFPLCEKHKINRVQFIKININEQDNVFKCAQCILDNNQTYDYLYINTVLNSQDDYIFKNWPPVNNQELINELIELVEDEKDPIRIIENEFNDFCNEIMQKIEQKKKVVLQCAQKLQIEKEEFQNIYKKLSEKENLKQILKQKVDFEQMNTDLKKFFFKCYDEKKQTDLSLLFLIQRIKQYKNIPKAFEIQQIKSQFFEQLDKLDETILNCNFFRERVDQIQQELNLIITNKTWMENYNIEQQINQLSENLRIYSDNSKFNFLNIKDNKNDQFSNTNQIRLLKEKEQFGNYFNSRMIKVNYDINQDIISIYKCKEIQYGYVYFNYEMKRNKKYIVRVRFNDQGGQYIIFGLINQNNMDTTIFKTKQGKSFCDYDTEYGGKVVQGSYFNEMSKGIIIEMRVDIEKRQIQFENNYKQINELQPKYLLDAQQIYYLTFHFGQLKKQQPFETLIDIIYFEEVDHF
ncbi:hypothetical protein ABPG72_001780 [Tetrahymena utriculariae]